jgi:peptide/nickel transport system permease protein
MIRFIAQRLVGMVVTMFVVSIIVFIIMQLPPGDYAERYAFRKFSGASGVVVKQSDIENLRHRFGLDRPLWQQYVDWIWGIVTRLDFGQAFTTEASVNFVIGQRLGFTLALLFSALIITYGISIPIGIYAAVRRHSIPDYSLTVFSYLGLALPNFLLALLLLYAASTYFGASVGGLFSPQFRDAPWSMDKLVDLLKHLVVPAIVLAWSATALQLQTVRATMLDEINKLSVTAARARGIPEWKVLLKYPARLAINPIAGSIGFDVNRIFSELPIVALVLGLSDLGELLIQSYLDQDMFVAGAILLMLTSIIVVLNFFSDILLAYLDPRIKLES